MAQGPKEAARAHRTWASRALHKRTEYSRIDSITVRANSSEFAIPPPKKRLVGYAVCISPGRRGAHTSRRLAEVKHASESNQSCRPIGIRRIGISRLLSASPFFSSTASYGGGAGGIVAAGTGTSFSAGTSGTPIGAEFADVDAGGFGPAEGFGSGFGIPGSSAEAGPSGFGPVGSSGFGTATGLAGGIGAVGTMAAEVGLGPLAIEGGGLPGPGMAFGALAASAGISAAASDDSGVGQMTITTGATHWEFEALRPPQAAIAKGSPAMAGRLAGAKNPSQMLSSAGRGRGITQPDPSNRSSIRRRRRSAMVRS